MSDDRLKRLQRSAARAGRRLRYRVALARLAVWLPLSLGLAAAALAAGKVLRVGPQAERALLFIVAAVALASLGAVLHGLFRRLPRWAGALHLDEFHSLDDRVTTALELSETPDAERSGFERAAIEEGLAVAARLDPRRAVPVRLPRELGVSALLGVLLVGTAWFEVRVERPVPTPPSFEPLVMSPDDLSLFGEIGKELAEKAEDPESLAAIRRFNALVEDIADRRLDRREAFERLGELEAELARMADVDREARELGLEGIARELARSGLTKEAAEALEQKRLADAEKALRELAERLRRKDKQPTRAELEKLRSAFTRAANVNSERLKAIEERRRELEQERKSLLDKHKDKAKDPKAPERDPKVQENKRKLERLTRDKERASRASRELSQLDRELAEAAQQLMKDLGKSAEDVEQGAEDLNRMAKRAVSDQEKRELLQRMRELREVLRQQGQAGGERQRQMMRFGERARGKQGPGGGQPGEGAKKGGKGKGQTGGPGQVTSLEIPRITQVPGSGQKPGGEGNPGQSSGSPGEPGKGHDPNIAGDPTARVGQTQDVTAAGVDSGEGTASAEVIHGAAERGFVGKGYRDVYVQYESVAEQALEHDQIPPGYRFYVRRYFQLIRPRE